MQHCFPSTYFRLTLEALQCEVGSLMRCRHADQPKGDHLAGVDYIFASAQFAVLLLRSAAACLIHPQFSCGPKTERGSKALLM